MTVLVLVLTPALGAEPPPMNGLPPPLRLSRRTIESLRLWIGLGLLGAVVPAAPIPAAPPPAAPAPPAAAAPAGELTPTLCGAPGRTPCPDLRSISARVALSHLISSSSLGAQRSSVRFVVTTLNVCVRVPAPSLSSGAVAAAAVAAGVR